MECVQVRINEEYVGILKELSETLHSSRSEVIRKIMEAGMKDLRMKIAMEKYLDEEFTLCRAAEFSGVSISADGTLPDPKRDSILQTEYR